MLRGASAEALAELSEKHGKTRTLADAATLAQDLFGVAGVLRGDAALRRVLTDSSVAGEAKTGLVQTIFGSALHENAVDLVSDAVQRRWTFGRDLPDALEQVGVVSAVRSAGKDGNRVTDELFGVRRLFVAHPELRVALADQSRSIQDRSALLRGLLEGNALPATTQLVGQAVSSGRGTVDVVLQSYLDIAAAALDEIVATVHTASELSTADEDRLRSALGKQYGTTVQLQVVVDPSLMGGARVEIGDDVIDGTVAGRLDDARRKLAG